MKFMLFASELWMLSGCLLLFMVALFDGGGKNARFWALAVVLGNVLLTSATFFLDGRLFFGVYRIDLFSQLFKLMIAVGLGVVVVMGRDLHDVSEKVKPEYYLFLLLSGLGLMMVVSCVELLSIFVSLELSSFALFILVPMRDERTGVRIQMESAAKYILYGVMATGIMLFGMSYLFGLTGTTKLALLIPRLHNLAMQPAAVIGILMVMGGFFFKLGLFPFHFWLPDVYQGASNETTAFIASVPKLAAVALLIRAGSLFMPEDHGVGIVLGGLAVASMFYGNLLALVQKDIKRLLGFSAIAHAGYIMLGILILKESGFATAIYYIAGYLLMNLACFLVICHVSTDGENMKVEDLRGLFQRAPLMALVLLVAMFALAGIPPFVGFMGKFMLLTGALTQGYMVLVVLAAINTAISIYYYLSVVRVAFCSAPGQEDGLLSTPFATNLMGVVLVAGIIALGLAPAPFLEMARQAVSAIL